MSTAAVAAGVAPFVMLLALMGMSPPGADQAAANCVGAHCGGPVLPGTPGTQGAPYGEGGLTPKTIRPKLRRV